MNQMTDSLMSPLSRHHSTIGPHWRLMPTMMKRHLLLGALGLVVVAAHTKPAPAQTPTPTPLPECDADDVAHCNIPQVTGTPIDVTCSQLNAGYTFAANKHFLIEGVAAETGSDTQYKCDLTNTLTITNNNVIIEGKYSQVDLRSATTGSCVASGATITVQANNVLLKELMVSCTVASPDGVGVKIADAKSNINFENVSLVNNHDGVVSQGDNVCLYETSARQSERDGVQIAGGAGGTYWFRKYSAQENYYGIHVLSAATSVDVKVWASTASKNYRSGFWFEGGDDVDILCSDADRNEPLSDAEKTVVTSGRGIVSSAARLQVENSTASDNWREGIVIEGGVAHVIATHLIDNNGGRSPGTRTGVQLLRTSGTMRVYNTVGFGATFINHTGAGPTPKCGSNLYTDGNSASNCNSGVNGTITGVPNFISRKRQLNFGSPGLDAGTDVSAAAQPTLQVRVADQQDRDGRSRPRDGDRNGTLVVDIGAFESNFPQATVTRTRTRTATPTKTPLGNTPTPTRTPTPCANQCHGDCDCDGSVEVNELIAGVNMALGSADARPCMDCNESEAISIAELIQAVGNALNGCPIAGVPCGDRSGGLGLLSVGDPPVVGISSLTGARNSTIEIYVYLADGIQEVSALGIDMGYSTSLIGIPECTADSRLPGGIQMSASQPSPGTTRLLFSNVGRVSCTDDLRWGGSILHCQGSRRCAARGKHALSGVSGTKQLLGCVDRCVRLRWGANCHQLVVWGPGGEERLPSCNALPIQPMLCEAGDCRW